MQIEASKDIGWSIVNQPVSQAAEFILVTPNLACLDQLQVLSLFYQDSALLLSGQAVQMANNLVPLRAR
jgi:hypothetical protein